MKALIKLSKQYSGCYARNYDHMILVFFNSTDDAKDFESKADSITDKDIIRCGTQITII